MRFIIESGYYVERNVRNRLNFVGRIFAFDGFRHHRDIINI